MIILLLFLQKQNLALLRESIARRTRRTPTTSGVDGARTVGRARGVKNEQDNDSGV
jgi:hypothetical protein